MIQPYEGGIVWAWTATQPAAFPCLVVPPRRFLCRRAALGGWGLPGRRLASRGISRHGRPMSGASPLPPAFAAALRDYERHLRAERGLSAHTLRAYLGDIADLFEYAVRVGAADVSDLDVHLVREWLAGQHARGLSRATLARRTAAVRTFTRFAQRDGLLGRDPGPLLGTPRLERALPKVLRQEQAAAVLDAVQPVGDGPAEPRRTGAESVILRDRAVLEVLYATGIRV